jgi:hypothetical protein
MIQSRTYNNGTILEYFYNISPIKGRKVKTSTFINIATGQQIDPKTMSLRIDFASENKFLGVCCNISCVNSWVTSTDICWACDDNFTWGL